MPSYYETLQVTPNASNTEIEAAYTEQYNAFRRLVMHHDPSVASDANRQLQTLESARATLMDPAKRAVYDAGLGLGGESGGLADPQAAVRSVVLPPAPRAPATPPAPTASSTLWTCPNPDCRAENPVNTKSCLKCGTQLVRECPACGKTASLVATGFCGECGAQYDTASRQAPARAVATRTAPAPRPVPVQQTVIVTSTKSVGLAFFLTFLFGPLGMFYSTVGGAVVMLIVSVVLAVLTFGVSLLITWPVCIIWGCVAASSYNSKLVNNIG